MRTLYGILSAHHGFKSLHKFCVLGLLLPVQILQLASNLYHARKVLAMFGAQLGPFLIKVAAPRMNLLQCRGPKLPSAVCRRGSEAIPSSGSPLDAARYSASRKMRSEVAETNCRLNSSISRIAELCCVSLAVPFASVSGALRMPCAFSNALRRC